MKKEYCKPELQKQMFVAEDVIAASGGLYTQVEYEENGIEVRQFYDDGIIWQQQ